MFDENKKNWDSFLGLSSYLFVAPLHHNDSGFKQIGVSSTAEKLCYNFLYFI